MRTRQPKSLVTSNSRQTQSGFSALPPINPEFNPSDPIRFIFDYWRQVHDHPRAKLDAKRQRLIAKTLEQGYSVTDCQQAILGCRNSPFHQGENPHGQRYDAISLIFRDADHIDRFIDMYQHPPTVRQAAYREAHGTYSGLDRLAEAFEADYGELLPEGNPLSSAWWRNFS